METNKAKVNSASDSSGSTFLHVGIKSHFLNNKQVSTSHSHQADAKNENEALDKKRKVEDTDEHKNINHGAKLSLKQRHQGTHPLNKSVERLCTFVGRGEQACPYGEKCQYSHDIAAFLASKPSDIAVDCPVFEKFGFCQNGFMCRYGDSHIDRTNLINITRPVDKGGVVDRVSINVLKKSTQLQLRKKSYISNVRSSEVTNNDANSAVEESDANVVEPAAIKSPEFDLSAYPSKEVKLVDFSNKVYVAPLTTVGNLPFRRILKEYGADITCGEMAMAANIQSAQASEWALLRRHESEDCFGVQIAGNNPGLMSAVGTILENETVTDFVDLNCGCPIDVVCQRGGGSALLNKPGKLCEMLSALSKRLPSRSVTVKVRIGWDEKHPTTHKLIPQLQTTAHGKLAAIFIHGRSRLQRYSKLANWDYVLQCAKAQDFSKPLVPVIGNGDILSWEDWRDHQHLLRENMPDNDSEVLGLCSCAMIGRGALIKPWLPQEIHEKRVIDIPATERLDIVRRFCHYGLEQWGSDQQGVNTTRRFLLEWLSFLHRYVPAGILERPQRMNQRPPPYFGRDDLETLLSSSDCNDWIRISEMFLGNVPDGFSFIPKHKTNSYAVESRDSCSSVVAGGVEDSVSNG